MYKHFVSYLQASKLARGANRFFNYDSATPNFVAFRIKITQMLQKNENQPDYDIWDKL